MTNSPACRPPQLEVAHAGWLHVFVATSRRVAAGEELTVQYPRGFWAGRGAALEAYAAADVAIDAGRAAAGAAAAPGGDALRAAKRTRKSADASRED